MFLLHLQSFNTAYDKNVSSCRCEVKDGSLELKEVLRPSVDRSENGIPYALMPSKSSCIFTRDEEFGEDGKKVSRKGTSRQKA